MDSKLIALQDGLFPKPNNFGKELNIQNVLHRIAQENEKLNQRKPIGSKTPVFEIGTDEKVQLADGNYEKGFTSTVFQAYANHWILATSPEDWWFTIIRKVALDIDAASKNETVRNFFVSHADKKELKVVLGTSIYANYSWFLEEMTRKIEENLNAPSYVNLMKSDFTTSKLTHKIIANIAIMSSVQEYFTYTGRIYCGIPKVEMKGLENDWRKLKEKVFALFDYLPSQVIDAIGERKWWPKVKKIVNKLLQTYQGNPDLDWWSRIISNIGSEGCGRPITFDGWFLKDFLHEEKFKDSPSGVVSVPMKLELPSGYTENAALLGGIAGNHIKENYKGNNTLIEAVHGWTLMLEPTSAFRYSKQTTPTWY